MNPLDRIEDILEVHDALQSFADAVEHETTEIMAQWQALGEIGAQRADHAAQLMLKLRPDLEATRRFLDRCIGQLDAMAADPFEVAQ